MQETGNNLLKNRKLVDNQKLFMKDKEFFLILSVVYILCTIGFPKSSSDFGDIQI